jgi:hypothetical protein
MVMTRKRAGKHFACFGVPAKGTMLLELCGLDRSIIDYAVDDNALKQNLYTPVTHIPIKETRTLYLEPPDCVVILAWNFADEILKKHQSVLQHMDVIVPLPETYVIKASEQSIPTSIA